MHFKRVYTSERPGTELMDEKSKYSNMLEKDINIYNDKVQFIQYCQCTRYISSANIKDLAILLKVYLHLFISRLQSCFLIVSSTFPFSYFEIVEI